MFSFVWFEEAFEKLHQSKWLSVGMEVIKNDEEIFNLLDLKAPIVQLNIQRPSHKIMHFFGNTVFWWFSLDSVL